MRCGDLSLTLRQHRLSCVIDPALLLCHAEGAALATRLARVVEGWLPRSFWQVIDASDWVLGDGPDPGLRVARCAPVDTQPLSKTAVRRWMAMRNGTDAGSWPLRWVGDNFAESQVQDGADADIVERTEALVDALAQRLALPDADPWRSICHGSGWSSLNGSVDLLALAAALESTRVLTCISPGATEPGPVGVLRAAGLAISALNPLSPDSLFAAERGLLRDAMAACGLPVLVDRLPALAVLHVRLGDGVDDRIEPAAATALVTDACPAPQDPWQDARAWWYPV
jgi:hypothetical protein